MVSVSPLISNSSSLPSLWGLFQVHQLQSVLLSPSCSIAFDVLWQDTCNCLSFRLFWLSLSLFVVIVVVVVLLKIFLSLTQFYYWCLLINERQTAILPPISWSFHYFANQLITLSFLFPLWFAFFFLCFSYFILFFSVLSFLSFFLSFFLCLFPLFYLLQIFSFSSSFLILCCFSSSHPFFISSNFICSFLFFLPLNFSLFFFFF